jgi:precorrin-6B methylase 2
VENGTNLRRGWTTGACAAAAAKAAFAALRTGTFPDPVDIPLPRGGRTSFTLAETRLEPGAAYAAIVKDAGDDPDVTHGAHQPGVIDAAWDALPADGRLVANAVTTETEAVLLAVQARLGGTLLRLAISRLDAVGPMHAFRPAMTVTQWVATKP